jgi:hypothetical protein
MDISGYGGRGAIWYHWPERVINGVRVSDPPKVATKGWNQRKWVWTPFGERPATGALLLRCGGCHRMLWVSDSDEGTCKCDYESSG